MTYNPIHIPRLADNIKAQLASQSFVMATLVKFELGSTASPFTYRFTDFSSNIVITGSEDYVVTKTGHLKYGGTEYITSLDENDSIQEGMVVTSDTYGFASGTIVSERELSGETYVKISPPSLSDAPAGSAPAEGGGRVGDRVINFTIPAVSEIYNANRFLLDIGNIKESSKLTTGSVNIQLSGVSQALIADFLNNGYINKKVTIKRAYLNSSTNALINTLSIFSGKIDSMHIGDSNDTSIIDLTVSNHWGDFSRKAGRLSTSDSQQQFFPNDKGFDFITYANLN